MTPVKPRDLAIVGAVLVLAGFAVADALRGGASRPTPEARDPTGGTTPTTPEDAEPVRDRFAEIQLGGTVVFTADDDCRLREVSVATGVEFPLPRLETNCRLWAPPTTDRIAYGVGGSIGEAVPFSFLDLNHSGRQLGTFRALRGFIAWSRDGQRAAWCDEERRGFEYELARDVRRLGECPLAYSPDGRVVHSDGRRLLAGDDVVHVASGHVDLAAWGRDGSLAVLVEGRALERWEGGRRTNAVLLPPRLTGRPPLLAPDNCAALLTIPGGQVHLVELGCFRGRNSYTNVSPDNCLNRRKATTSKCARFRSPRTFPGTAAAWSPDGSWIAVVEFNAIAFHRVVGRYDVVRWDVEARELIWH